MWPQIAKNFLEAWKKTAWRTALLVAVLSDIIAYNPISVLAPPVQWVLDALTVIALFMALGFRWILVPALVVEAIPGLMLFPFWTLAVAAMAATEESKPSADPGEPKLPSA